MPCPYVLCFDRGGQHRDRFAGAGKMKDGIHEGLDEKATHRVAFSIYPFFAFPRSS